MCSQWADCDSYHQKCFFHLDNHVHVPTCLSFQYHADPLVRNIREESPLELAAQYGRLDTVQLLLRQHPGLLGDTVDKHSALHLASRNGHKTVVQVLIDAGFNINTKVGRNSLQIVGMYLIA